MVALGKSTGSNLGIELHYQHSSRVIADDGVEPEQLREAVRSFGDVRSLRRNGSESLVAFFDLRAAERAYAALRKSSSSSVRFAAHHECSDLSDNTGTLVVFNLDDDVYHDRLWELFSQCGDLKVRPFYSTLAFPSVNEGLMAEIGHRACCQEIRETPGKKSHRFIEFYDVREAESALQRLHKSVFNGRHITIERAKPGGSKKASSSMEAPNLVPLQPPMSAAVPAHTCTMGIGYNVGAHALSISCCCHSRLVCDE